MYKIAVDFIVLGGENCTLCGIFLVTWIYSDYVLGDMAWKVKKLSRMVNAIQHWYSLI